MAIGRNIFLIGVCLACVGAGLSLCALAATSKPNSNRTHIVITPKPAPVQSATQFDGLMGGIIDLKAFHGKAVLVVNTASQCGFTGQYGGLETLYRAKARAGLVIVGVPSNDFGQQEPGSAGEIQKFCELNYGVTFPMAAKTVVRGAQAHPFYRNALAQLGSKAQPAWNFHKILLDTQGRPIAAFPSATTPDSPELLRAINNVLGAAKAPAAKKN